MDSIRSAAAAASHARATVVVTTSWDDGHCLDEQLADVLADHGVAASFYLAPKNAEIRADRRLSHASIRRIAQSFEIGSHTLTHPRLTRLDSASAAREIALGRDELEQVVGKSVTSFCYPYGAYNVQHVKMVEDLGFVVGRTTRRFCVEWPSNLLQMSTTSHAVRRKADAWPVLRRSRTASQALSTWASWDVLARRLFEEALVKGGVYHLWGHSWEIEENGDWQRLRSFLRYVASVPGVLFLTNGELARPVEAHAEEQLRLPRTRPCR